MRKYCIVPKCKNTSFKTPEKLFFYVPKDPKLRKKWCTVMKKYGTISCTSGIYCCEDHFDIEQDMENYMKYKLMGGILKLKKGVVPHKFDCQKPPKKTIERNGFKKRRTLEYLERVLSSDIGHEDLLSRPIEVVECKNEPDSSVDMDPLDIPEEIDLLSSKTVKGVQKTRGIQVKMKPHVRSVSTSTPLIWQEEVKPKMKNKCINTELTCIEEAYTSSSEKLTDDAGNSSDWEPSVEIKKAKKKVSSKKKNFVINTMQKGACSSSDSNASESSDGESNDCESSDLKIKIPKKEFSLRRKPRKHAAVFVKTESKEEREP